MIFGLSAINIVSILFFKYSLESQLSKEAYLYLELYKYNPTVKLPPYIKITQNLPDLEKYQLIHITTGKYILLDNTYKNQQLKEFAFILLMWDGVLILSLMFIMHFTIIRYIKKEEFIKKYLEILLLTITHKLGNFLSVQRLNIDIIKSKCNLKAIERLENAYSLIEKDFRFTVEILKNLRNTQKKKTTLNLKEIIQQILPLFQENLKNKKLKLKLKDIYIKADINDIENILFVLIENAIKYSDKKIYIKICQKNKEIFIFIKNDIKHLEKGSGVGLEIAKFLVSQYGGEIKIRAGKSFLAILKFPI